MRKAILFAPQALESEVVSSCEEAGAEWLAKLVEHWGYGVVRAAGAAAFAELQGALADVSADDTLLVHVSGSLRDASTLDDGSRDGLAIAEIDRLVGTRGTGSFVLAELAFPSGRDDALALAEDIAQLRAAFMCGGAIVAVHGAARVAESLPFTRLVAEATRELFRDGREAVLASDVVELLREMPESHAVARSYTFVGSTRAFDLARANDEVLDAPEFDVLLELADGAREAASLPHAIAGYRAALQYCKDDDARGLVYARLGEIEEAEGHAARARRAYRKAIAASPTERGPRDALVRLESNRGEWAAAISAMEERLTLIESPVDRTEELFSLARLTLEKLRDMPGAVRHLEAARALDGRSEDVLEALRRSYRVLGRWSELIDVTGALAEIAPSATERAARRFAQAQIARKHGEDLLLATGFLHQALADDPTHDEALEVLCEVRTTRHEEELLEKELGTLLARLLTLGEDDRAADVARRISSLDTPPVRRAETTQEITPDQMIGLEDEPLDDDRRQDRRDERREEEHGDVDEDDALTEEDLRNEMERAPLVADHHTRLFATHLRLGQTDRAYLSALVLEELGVVDETVEDVLEQGRPSGLRVRAALDPDAWRLLRAPGSDDVLEGLVRAIGRAAAATRAEDRKAKKRNVVLDESRRQSDKSTASIVRTFYWAADILGVPCPELYVLDRVPGDVVAVPTSTSRKAQATAIGPDVLSGLSTIDLAFLCARHLTYYRPEYAALIDFPSLGELSLLVLAALQVALPAMPVPANVEGAVAHLRNGLTRHLLPEEREAMRVAVAKLDARGGRVNLQAWIRSVELTATRIGLLLAGDLRVAMARMRSEERTVSELSLESKRIDLIGFCAMGELAELRERFSAPVTLRPPRESGLMARLEVGGPVWSEEVTGAAS
jgi:tetratricopeptide (TPR) repeat protein